MVYIIPICISGFTPPMFSAGIWILNCDPTETWHLGVFVNLFFFFLRTNAPPEGHLTFTSPRLSFFSPPFSKAGHLIHPQGLRAVSVVFWKPQRVTSKKGSWGTCMCFPLYFAFVICIWIHLPNAWLCKSCYYVVLMKFFFVVGSSLNPPNTGYWDELLGNRRGSVIWSLIFL